MPRPAFNDSKSGGLMRKKNRKLNLTRETLTVLDSKNLEQLAAGAAIGCQESRIVCSVQHTCVSCKPTDTCA